MPTAPALFGSHGLLLSAFWYLLRVQLLAHGVMRELPSARAEMELPSALSAQLSPLRHVDEVADLLQALQVYPRETPKRGDRIAQHLGQPPFETKALVTRLEALEDSTSSRLTEVGLGAADLLVLVVPMQCCVACGGQELLVSRGRAATYDSLRIEWSSARARHVTRQQRRCAILTI